MAKTETVPAYVHGTAQDLAKAREMFAMLQKNFAWQAQQGIRRSALTAKFNSAMPLTPLEYVEFENVIPDGYRAHFGKPDPTAVLLKERADAAKREYESEQKAKREQKRPIADAREAAATLSPAEYNKWLDNPANQAIVNRTIF